ncbi:MAG: DUF2103 domain-containing protein [Halobacteriaceae archaeon]
MECRECGSTLDRPGDYCLVCHTANTDTAVVEADRTAATLTMLSGGEIVGETTVTTTPESGEDERRERRNFVGRVADELRRKRPDSVFVAGERTVLRALRAAVHYELRRVGDDDPVAAVLAGQDRRSLAVVDDPPSAKIGGTHSTLVGGRDGRAAVTAIAGHPHVKKVVPGPIESGNARAGGGVRAKATRADPNGNVRLILRDGSSVQENRVVTTAMDRETGEQVRTDLNEALADEGFRD